MLFTFVVTPDAPLVPSFTFRAVVPGVPVLKLKLPPVPKPRPETVSFGLVNESVPVALLVLPASSTFTVAVPPVAVSVKFTAERMGFSVLVAGVPGALPTLTVFVPALPTKLTGSPVFDPRALYVSAPALPLIVTPPV